MIEMAAIFMRGIPVIQIPTTLCDIVGMTDPMPELRSTTAQFANF